MTDTYQITPTPIDEIIPPDALLYPTALAKSEGTLPPGWAWAKLEEVTQIQSGVGFPESYQGQKTGDLPFVKVSDISIAVSSKNGALFTAANYISFEKAKELKGKAFPQGTTLFAKIGEAVRLNRRAMAKVSVLADNNVMGLIPDLRTALPLFIFYFTHRIDLYEYTQATVVPSVRKSDVEKILIPIAPLAEQQRIVAEIEKQFTRLDAAVSSLKRAQLNLKRYKAAVLKAACEGKLVPQNPTDEPAAQLLERILVERQTKWAADLRAKGKDPTKATYEAPTPPNTADLPDLPPGWVWAKIGNILDISYGKGLVTSERDETGQFPVYGSNGVVGNHNSPLVNNACLIIGRKGAAGVVHISKTACWVIDTAYFLTPPKKLSLNYLYYALTRLNLSLFDKSTAVPSLSRDDLNTQYIPLPLLAEQERIVAEVERRLSVVAEMEAAVKANLKRAERLRQSILKKAFAGKLVPQDSSDEPASVLLERIRTTREAQNIKPAGKPAKTKAKAAPRQAKAKATSTQPQLPGMP